MTAGRPSGIENRDWFERDITRRFQFACERLFRTTNVLFTSYCLPITCRVEYRFYNLRWINRKREKKIQKVKRLLSGIIVCVASRAQICLLRSRLNIVIIVIMHKNIRLFSPFACAITKVTCNTRNRTSRNIRSTEANYVVQSSLSYFRTCSIKRLTYENYNRFGKTSQRIKSCMYADMFVTKTTNRKLQLSLTNAT